MPGEVPRPHLVKTAFLTEKQDLDCAVARPERGDRRVPSMYLSYFGFAENPFNVTPDPRFLYLGSGHREALDQLQHSAREGGGLIVLTGKTGTGKTILLRALRERLDEDTAVSYVFNTTLPFDGIVEYMLEDLGVAKPEESPERRLGALSGFLLERERAGQRTVIVVDEAQNLDAEKLEQISQLASVEGRPSQLLEVLLVGQPELRSRLDHADLRHVRQRVSVRCQVPPLAAGDVGAYIRNRLQVAGAPDLALFNGRAIKRIARHCGGIPRRINILADHCLLFAYADQRRRVDRSAVSQAIAYLEETLGSPRAIAVSGDPGFWDRFGWMFAVGGVALASAAIGFLLAAF